MTAETVRDADHERVEAALRGCATEPIRVPGSIQPHGVLLALRGPDLRVACASANADGVFGRPAAALVGARLATLFPEPEVVTLRAAAVDPGATLPLVSLPTAQPGGVRTFTLLLSRADGLLVAELEPASSGDPEPWWQRLSAGLQRLQAARSPEVLARALADEVRTLTGFDRVMVYRFDPAWNGEVVAEAREAALEPFLGLRYPASDIPAQARELYRTQWLRLIPDVGYTPVPLVPADPVAGRPLDLGATALRSVSPAHVEYLRAMGVAASMSVSLVVDGRLWGLVACHHYAGPRRPDARVRSAAEFLGRTASVLLGGLRAEGDAERILATSAAETALIRALAASPRHALDALAGTPGLLDLVPAGGAVLRLGGVERRLGAPPPSRQVEGLVATLWPGGERGTVATASLAHHLGAHGDDPGVVGVDPASASGVLAVPVPGGDGRDHLLWFRPEVLQEVTWGGDPEATRVVDDAGGLRLGPRRSFARWVETVRGTAEPWRPHEVRAAERLARHVAGTVLRRAEEEARLVAALQRTVLGEPPPELPGLDLAVRYAPHADDVVGGDWYDVVPLPRGRVAVVVGDAAGHGLGVSALGAQLRLGLRAHLLSEPSPGRALERLNELVAWQLGGELATVVVAVLDPATGQARVAVAGHPPPLLLRPGAPQRAARAEVRDTRRGPALGVIEDVAYPETVLALAPGEGLLLYTDGLVERRDAGLDERLHWLERQAAEGGDATTLCDRLLAAVPRAEDDVTVVAVLRRAEG